MKLIIEETDITAQYNIENISPKGEMLLFDIETTGLKKETTQIYLIGCGYFNAEGNFEVRQWLAESALDEREVLEAFFDFAKDYSVLIQFNGDGFDIPYVAYKAEYYGYDFDFNRFESVDIYKKLKPYKKFLGLERMNQTSIEAFLGIKRRDKMNGGILIPYFYEYERSGDAECERLLLLHNNDDVRGMIQLTDALSYADIFDGRFELKENMPEIYGDTFILEYVLENKLPKPILYQENGLMIAAEEELLQINLKINDGPALIPVKNIQDYYYLPLEDKIIHKDVAEFVDKKYRKKATAKNCFLKKEGRFIPTYGMESELFMRGEKGKLKEVFELEKAVKADSAFCHTFAQKILAKI